MSCAKCGGDHETTACPHGWLTNDPSAIRQPTPVGAPFRTPAPQADPLIGLQVGNYRILRMLGTGGMGSVYLGEHTGIGSKVAIKFLHEHLSSNADLVQRFYAEARAVNVIGHGNIVSIFDMNVFPPSRYYLVMEYLEGIALESLVATGPMQMARAVPILAQVCDALDQAHAAGIVHRDLKPENIILVKRGRAEDVVKILDFGIAKLQSSMASRKTATGIIIGTPDYMAPEQAQSENVDGRTDQYSLGIIAYELATGKTPFAGLPITSMLVAHLSQDPKPPHELNPALPQAISAVILKALAKKPDARFASCGDFGRALELALKESQQPAGAFMPQVSFEPAANRATPAPPDAAINAVSSTEQSYRGLPPVQLQGDWEQPQRAQSGSGARPVAAWDPPKPSQSGTNPAFVPSPPPQSGLNPVFVPTPQSQNGLPAVPWDPRALPRTPPPSNSPQSQTGLKPVAATPSPGGPGPVHPVPPVPVPPRHVVRFEVQVKGDGPEQTLPCQDVSRAGCFVVSKGPPPRVFSRVTVTVPDVGAMQADVVRHVTKDQAEAWNMPQGFGLQFVNARPEQREALDNITRGLPVAPVVPQTPASHTDDPIAERTLAEIKKRIQGDHYVVLALPNDVDFPQVKARGRELNGQLAEIGKRNLSATQRKQLEATVERVKGAIEVLGTPNRRVEFDGMRFNWKGVGACLSGGLRVTELEEVRKRFLKANEGTEARSQLHLITANSHERDGHLSDALRVIEHALSVDPLNIELHHRRKSLQRHLATAPAKK